MAGDKDVVCCKCDEDGKKEKLSRCYATGMSTLKAYCEQLGRDDIVAKINNQWADNRLRIHKSCRISLANDVIRFRREHPIEEDQSRERERKRRRVSTVQPSDINSAHPSGSSAAHLVYKDVCILCLHEATTYDKYPDQARNSYRRIQTLELKQNLIKHGNARGDEWGMAVVGRLSGISDLVAEESKYHIICKIRYESNRTKPHSGLFGQRGRPVEAEKEQAFEDLCSFLDNEIEHKLYTLSEIHDVMISLTLPLGGPVFGKHYLKKKLLSRYEDIIYFTSEENRKDILCFKNTTNTILREFKDEDAKSDEEKKKIIISACVKFLINDIKIKEIGNGVYPAVGELTKPSSAVPDSLLYFMSHFTKSEDQAQIWGQNFVKGLRPRSGVMPYHLGLAIQLDHRHGSKWLIERMHNLGYCESYKEMNNYKWSYLEAKTNSGVQPVCEIPRQSVADDGEEEREDEEEEDEERAPTPLYVHAHDEEMRLEREENLHDTDMEESHTEESRSEESDFTNEDEEVASIITRSSHSHSEEETGGQIRQFVGDNVDLSIRSLHGNTAFHAMGSIRISTPEPEDKRTLVPKRKPTVTSQRKAELLKAVEVKLVPYHKRDSELHTLIYRPFKDLQTLLCSTAKPKLSPADYSWFIGWIIHRGDSTFQNMNWKGFMKGIHPTNTREKSQIEMLPIINGDPNAYSTIYTTILRCLQYSDTKPGKPIVITFDFPIWIKAVEIAITMKLPVIARLGGFHLMKSFLGSIGYIMEGSGIEDLIKLVYPSIGDSTVGHILSGGAYYKALRCHFLIDAALVTHLMKDDFTVDDLKIVTAFIIANHKEKTGSDSTIPQVRVFQEALDKKLGDMESSGRTPALWVQYHQQVTLVKVFIRAERLHLMDLHLSCVAQMLTTFAAAGHTKYAKGARLYLELMLKHKLDYNEIFNVFCTKGYHTVRYSTHEWSGVWTDLSIEQTLMKAAKSSGGLKGGRFRNVNNAYKLWCCTLDHLSEINKEMGSAIKSKAKKFPPHVDARNTSMMKDSAALDRVLTWITDNNPFDITRKTDVLVSFNTGLVSQVDDSINPEGAEEVGLQLQQFHDGSNYTETMHTKLKVKPLSNLKKPVKVNGKDVYIDSMKLFARLMIIGERELSVQESLAYELTPLPASLFDNKQAMRKTNKATLGKLLKSKFETSKLGGVHVTVIDGGWLLYQVTWEDDSTYGKIAESYAGYAKSLQQYDKAEELLVVFDGYNPSTKDHEHGRRGDSGYSEVEVTANKKVMISKTKFLKNYKNKNSLIQLIMQTFREQGIRCEQAPADGDTLVVKRAIELSSKGTVNVLANDTDILVLLVHHRASFKDFVFLTADNKSYDICGIVAALTETEKRYLLVTHSFSGCDTVSAFFGFGKIRFFKLISSKLPKDVLDTFMDTGSPIPDIENAGIKLFELLYSSQQTGKSKGAGGRGERGRTRSRTSGRGGRSGTTTSAVSKRPTLGELRYYAYNKMCAKGIVRPERLPPTQGAAVQHSLRAYLQIHDWVALQCTSLDPTLYGWKINTEGVFEPVGTLETIAPEQLQNLITCSCKTGCKSNSCSCKKNNLPCMTTCTVCRGSDCANANTNIDHGTEDVEDVEDVDDTDYLQ